jgi:sec-independent protein translocase protein TatC
MSEEATQEARMSFRDHLRELRDRLVRVAIAVLIGFFITWGFKEVLFEFVAGPMREALAKNGVYGFTAIEVTETIFVYLKMSIIAGIVLTLPFTFYQLWSFIAPGLVEKEKRAIAPLVFFSTFFFLIGAFFAYEVIIPFVCDYLAALTNENTAVAMQVTVKSAFGFSLMMLLAFGIAFELPLVMFFLSFLGLVTPMRFLKFWRYFIVLSFIIGALFTPPDPISQLLMAGPLNVLYGIGILAAILVTKRRKQAESGIKPKIPSRVWGILSTTLLIFGAGLIAVTWWMGRTHSPLQWVPDDARWVVSVHVPNLLGDDTARSSALRTRLGLTAETPKTQQVILVGGPDGKRLAILPGVCKDETPSLGTCADNDLLLGDSAYIEQAKDQDKSLYDNKYIRNLSTAAPAWAWQKQPEGAWLKWLPEYDAPGTNYTVTELSFSADLRGESPWVTLSVRLDDDGALTSLQNQIDRWRAVNARRQSLTKTRGSQLEQNRVLLGLLGDMVQLSEEEATVLVTIAPKNPRIANLRARHEKLRGAIKKQQVMLVKQSEAKKKVGSSLLDKLGAAGFRSWHTSVKDGLLHLRIVLTAPQGVDALLELLPTTSPILETSATSSN